MHKAHVESTLVSMGKEMLDKIISRLPCTLQFAYGSPFSRMPLFERNLSSVSRYFLGHDCAPQSIQRSNYVFGSPGV